MDYDAVWLAGELGQKGENGRNLSPLPTLQGQESQNMEASWRAQTCRKNEVSRLLDSQPSMCPGMLN
jgi:hypothetical protein